MTRRLLRTITVTITVAESWTLVWHDAAGEPSTIRCYTQCVSSRTTSAATIAHTAQAIVDNAADRAGSSDASPVA